MIECPRCARENEDEARFCVGCGENLAALQNDRPRKDTYMGLVLDGKYMVLDHLGDGGMGKVYKAEQLSLNKTVAIKILHKTLLQNETQVKRFQREAWSASRLEHPNSIGIIDFGQTDDNSHFIVMEYLEGKDLSDVIRTEFPLSPERIVHILSQVLSVLHEAHSNKIIHRDLKPDNIKLIRRAEQEDYVKVLDFGIAKLQERDSSMPALTLQGIVCGTPEYMSPEQAMGKDLDSRTDIYSAGCILYELLTGLVPFDANNYQAILGMHIRDEAISPAARRPDLDIHPKLQEVARIAMQKDRNLRFPDAHAMKLSLELSIRESDPEASAPSRRVVNRAGGTHVMETASESVVPQPTPSKTAIYGEESSSPGLPPLPPISSTTLEVNAQTDTDDTPPPTTDEFVYNPIPITQGADASSNERSSSSSETASGSFSTDNYASSPGVSPGKIGLILVVLVGVIVASLWLIFGSAPEETGPTDPKLAINEVDEPAAVEKTGEAILPPDGDPELEQEAEVEAEKSVAPIRKMTVKNRRSEPKLDPQAKQKLALEEYENGNRAFRSEDYHQALKHYNLARKYNSKSAPVYKKLGLTYLKLDQKKPAKNYFLRYLKMAPRASDAGRIRELANSL